MIRIVNLKNYKLNENEVLFKVDRSTCLGNPYPMKSEEFRNYVCDSYIEYFTNILLNNFAAKEYLTKNR